MIRPLRFRRLLHNLLTRSTLVEPVAAIRQELHEWLGSIASITDMTNAGFGTPTFLLEAGDGRRVVVKVSSRWREWLYRRVLTDDYHLRETTYLRPGERFQREFALLKAFSPYGVCPRPLDVTERFLVREYVRGHSLRQRLRVHDVRSADYFLQGLGHLSCLHRMGHFHNDPTPDNLIIEEESGAARYIDFEFKMNAATYDPVRNAARDYERFILTTEAVANGALNARALAGRFIREAVDPPLREHLLAALGEKLGVSEGMVLQP